jgi:hypothetical protein
MKLPGKILLLILASLFSVFLNSCSKRVHPSKTATVTPISGVSTSDPAKTDSASVVTEKKVVRNKPKIEFPKVITVNDNAASKSVDGRYYYDVQGHRYWRNNKDGKYYLFNKSMYNNPDFKGQN